MVINSIFCTERKIVSFKWTPMSIITVHETGSDKTEGKQIEHIIDVMAKQNHY